MSTDSWIPLKDYAQRHSISYASAHRHFTNGMLDSKRSPSGSVLVRVEEPKRTVETASEWEVVTTTAPKRPFVIGLALLLTVVGGVGVTAATGAVDYSPISHSASATLQYLFPADDADLKQAARDGAMAAQLAIAETGDVTLAKTRMPSTDSIYVKLEDWGGNYTVTAVDRHSGDAYRYDSATGGFTPASGIYDANSGTYR